MEYLKRYERPDHFADFGDIDRNEYFVVYGQHRDSDTLSRSNFRSILKALGGESDTVLVIRDSHWAVGWVEEIYIHESDTVNLGLADRMLKRLADYPVFDEDDWSNLQFEEACRYWESMNVETRVEVCQKFSICVFAARRAELPEDPQGGLVDYLADGN